MPNHAFSQVFNFYLVSRAFPPTYLKMATIFQTRKIFVSTLSDIEQIFHFHIFSFLFFFLRKIDISIYIYIFDNLFQTRSRSQSVRLRNTELGGGRENFLIVETFKIE